MFSKAAGLEIVADVLETEALLIANPNSGHSDIVHLIKRRIEGYNVATKYVMISYNVHNDILDDAIKITPGKKSPNITQLLDSDYKAVTALVEKKSVPLKMDQLQDLGATDILTFQLSNTRM